MTLPFLNELNLATTINIMPGLADLFFKNGPVMRFVKEQRNKLFDGGLGIQENALYKPLKGGAYADGTNFDITKYQTRLGMQFTMKRYEVGVTEYLEKISIEMKSPHAAFNVVKDDLSNAAMTLSAMLEIALMQHGQDIAGDNRLIQINGFEEALNDGVNASWSGKTFTSYGLQNRADVNPALLPAGGTWTPPGQSATTPVVPANINGPITNRVLEHSYSSCCIGEETPKLGITTNRGMAFINEKYAPLQRLQDTVEPTISWPGIKFKNATIIQSQYMPGKDGINDPDLGNYYASDGETFLWLNPGPAGDECYFRLHTSSSPQFQFGFTGFKPAQNNTQLAGQVLWAGNFTVRVPRLMRMLFGILS